MLKKQEIDINVIFSPFYHNKTIVTSLNNLLNLNIKLFNKMSLLAFLDYNLTCMKNQLKICQFQ